MGAKEMDDRLSEALDEVLAALARGEPRDEWLARYPELASELAALIETREQLQALSDVPRLAASAVALCRDQFLSAARIHASRPVPANPLRRLVEWTHSSGGKVKAGWVPALARAAVALLILFAGFGGTVVLAQSSLPDSPLYRLKLAIEDARLSLAGSPSQRVALNLAFAASRSSEVEGMAASDRAIDAHLQERLQVHLDAALQNAAQAGDQDMPRLLEQIRVMVQTQERSLERAQLSAPEDTREALRRAEQAMAQARVQAEAALGDLQRFRQRHREGGAMDETADEPTAPAPADVEPTAPPTRRAQTKTPTPQTTPTPSPTRTPEATDTPPPTATRQDTPTPRPTNTPDGSRTASDERPASPPGPQVTVTPQQEGPGSQPTPGEEEPPAGEGDSGAPGGDGGSGSEGGGGSAGSNGGDGGTGSETGDSGGGSDSGGDGAEAGGETRRP
jgi:uncharacterized membrane protein YgcG